MEDETLNSTKSQPTNISNSTSIHAALQNLSLNSHNSQGEQKRGRMEDEEDEPRNKVVKVMPPTHWITVYHVRRPMKQRYHYNMTDQRLGYHIKRGYRDDLYISSVASCRNLWALIMDAGTGFRGQIYNLSPHFLHKDWILEQWKKGYSITAVAGATNGSSIVVMSRGTSYLHQSYKISDPFPLKWIDKKRREGYFVTSMATSDNKWAVVMSTDAGFSDQIVKVDDVHTYSDSGYSITATAATSHHTAFVLSLPIRRPSDKTQETLSTSEFPSTCVKEKWERNLYVTSVCYGASGFITGENL